MAFPMRLPGESDERYRYRLYRIEQLVLNAELDDEDLSAAALSALMGVAGVVLILWPSRKGAGIPGFLAGAVLELTRQLRRVGFLP